MEDERILYAHRSMLCKKAKKMEEETTWKRYFINDFQETSKQRTAPISPCPSKDNDRLGSGGSDRSNDEDKEGG